MNTKALKVLKIGILLVCILLGLFFSACKRESIKFYRESKVQEALKTVDQFGNKKDTIKKSSGIIIYKDNSYQNNQQHNKMNFGPKDPDFKFKF